MKKLFVTIGILLVTAALFILVAFVIGSKRQVVPSDYQTRIETGGVIEAKYLGNGSYKVAKKEEPLLLDFKKFTIYYPEELETTNRRYPVLVITNGSGTPFSKIVGLAEHYASWGFVVIGTEEMNAWNAFGAEMSLRYLERMDAEEQVGDKASLFYQKIDFDNVGIVGHSQGGVGVINAITDTQHQSIYKTAVALSPTNKELAHNLFWDYDATKIVIPTLLISGAGGGDDWVVTGEQLTEIYQDILANKVKVRRKDTAHNEVLYVADGYVTAWFMWQLQGDQEAAQAFVGEMPEITENPKYQDVEMGLK
ncbi:MULTISPECIES: lipase [Streptococcus]|uniref:poly(ethylene terephthalate) hydrolase family protein n=1 Tax=Streptococcus TaxID=1301 RepID=UPI001C8D4FE3|nr:MULTISPECIES: lipase [Streptococcus]MBY0720390.1 lipase [Streptococcus sp. 2018110]MCO8235911.1 lipase [Streptococcus suis]HEM3553184.1 lipase [Streptococcus suis]